MSIEPMRLTVLYFATLRDRAGLRDEEVTLPDGARVADLLALLRDRHAGLETALPSTLVSINREYAFPDDLLHDGDEVALFPPVSGGASLDATTVCGVVEAPLDVGAVLEELILPATGAACVLTGVMGEFYTNQGDRTTEVRPLDSNMTVAESKMRHVTQEIGARWPAVTGIAILQRVGRLEPGAANVLIACASDHGDTGVFEAARYGIDRMKQMSTTRISDELGDRVA